MVGRSSEQVQHGLSGEAGLKNANKNCNIITQQSNNVDQHSL